MWEALQWTSIQSTVYPCLAPRWIAQYTLLSKQSNCLLKINEWIWKQNGNWDHGSKSFFCLKQRLSQYLKKRVLWAQFVKTFMALKQKYENPKADKNVIYFLCPLCLCLCLDTVYRYIKPKHLFVKLFSIILFHILPLSIDQIFHLSQAKHIYCNIFGFSFICWFVFFVFFYFPFRFFPFRFLIHIFKLCIKVMEYNSGNRYPNTKIPFLSTSKKWKLVY